GDDKRAAKCCSLTTTSCGSSASQCSLSGVPRVRTARMRSDGVLGEAECPRLCLFEVIPVAIGPFCVVRSLTWIQDSGNSVGDFFRRLSRHWRRNGPPRATELG